jgi:hypothetical protein
MMDTADRRHFLDMARSRAKPGSGSLLRFLKESPSDYAREPEIPDLGDVRFVIVGGLATARYMPQRMTLDTDILIASEDLEEAEEALRSGGCRRLGPLSVGGSTWLMPGGRTLDVLALRRPWLREALESASRGETGRPYVAVPYLVLMKLESGRLQDLADISRMLGFAEESPLDETRRIVSQYRPEDAEDLESMIRLGKLEHEAR